MPYRFFDKMPDFASDAISEDGARLASASKQCQASDMRLIIIQVGDALPFFLTGCQILRVMLSAGTGRDWRRLPNNAKRST